MLSNSFSVKPPPPASSRQWRRPRHHCSLLRLQRLVCAWRTLGRGITAPGDPPPENLHSEEPPDLAAHPCTGTSCFCSRRPSSRIHQQVAAVVKLFRFNLKKLVAVVSSVEKHDVVNMLAVGNRIHDFVASKITKNDEISGTEMKKSMEVIKSRHDEIIKKLDQIFLIQALGFEPPDCSILVAGLIISDVLIILRTIIKVRRNEPQSINSAENGLLFCLAGLAVKHALDIQMTNQSCPLNIAIPVKSNQLEDVDYLDPPKEQLAIIPYHSREDFTLHHQARIILHLQARICRLEDALTIVIAERDGIQGEVVILQEAALQYSRCPIDGASTSSAPPPVTDVLAENLQCALGRAETRHAELTCRVDELKRALAAETERLVVSQHALEELKKLVIERVRIEMHRLEGQLAALQGLADRVPELRQEIATLQSTAGSLQDQLNNIVRKQYSTS